MIFRFERFLFCRSVNSYNQYFTKVDRIPLEFGLLVEGIEKGKPSE
jgi:hypothetical protein